MHTPGHAVLNLAVLGRKGDRWRVAPVLAGAVLPDVPAFVFYAQEKLRGVPEAVIWSRDYFASGWQPVLDALHSFPLIGLGLLLAVLAKRRAASLFFASLGLHALLDFPVHHDDAHRQLFPLSDWRFQSPLSYWDPRHLGGVGFVLEAVVVLGASVVLVRRGVCRAALAAVLVVDALYVVACVAFRIMAPTA